MNLLEAIARDLRRPEDQLRLPADLLRQGYDPSYLARVRPDELNQLDAATLARLRRALRYRDLLEQHKASVRESMTAQGAWTAALSEAIAGADSKAQVHALTKFGSSRRGTKALAAANPAVEALATSILMYSGPAPADFREWAKATSGADEAQLDTLIQETKNYLQALLLEDARLVSRVFDFIRQRAVLQSSELHADPEDETEKKPGKSKLRNKGNRQPRPNSSGADATAAQSESGAVVAPASEVVAAVEISEESAVPPQQTASITSQEQQSSEEPAEDLTQESSPSESSEAVANSEPVEAPTNTAEGPTAAAETPAIEIKNFETAKKKTRAVSAKELSPRQRRRRWLKFQLEPYYKLRRSLAKLSPFQIVMLGRGHRSQILKVELDYDRKAVAKMARESLFQKDHPLSDFLNQVVDEAVSGSLTSRIEQEVFAAAEEQAQQELLEYAVEHLQHLLMQRPLQGHRIMMIDAIGTRTAAVVIVDPEGRIDHVAELPCDSSRPDVVNQNVRLLGEWTHMYNVSVLAVSTGPARRFVLPSIREFMSQSDPDTIRWTMVDRDGADTYCTTRLALKELPDLSRRHRAAAWLAWRLQDPLVQLLKIDPTKLRLAVFQAELPPELIEESLKEAVASSVATRGIDYWNGHSKAMACIPGLNDESAKTICEVRDSVGPESREALINALIDKLPNTKLRQSIGFLRIFNSPEPLDGTLIHPDDYRLAQRLISNTELETPPATPTNWSRQSSTETVDDGSPASEAPAEQQPDGFDQLASQLEAESEQASAEEHVETSELSDAGSSDEQAAVTEESVPEPVSESTESAEPAQASSDEPVEAQEEAPAVEGVASETSTEKAAKLATTFGGHQLAALTPNFIQEPDAKKSAAVDAEKLARMWQVGREKLKFVAQVLQHPFDDPRESLNSIPLMKRVPKIEDLEVGTTMWAIVSGIADFGVFADLGPDCSGLIHVSRLSRNYVEDPRQVVNIGDLVQVWVQDVDVAKRRISLTALPPGVVQQSRASSDHGERSGDHHPHHRGGGDHHRGGGPNRGGQGRGRDGGDNRSRDGRSQPAGAGARGGSGGGKPSFQRSSNDQQQPRQGDTRQGDNRGGSKDRPRDSQRGNDSRPKFGGQGGNRDRDRNRGGRRGPNIGNATVIDLPSKELPVNARKGNASSDDSAESGKNTMRSFSDLLARFQTKHEETKQSPPEE